MLKLSILFSLLISSISTVPQEMSLTEIRNEYFYASFGSELIEGFNNKLLKIKKRTPIIVAYDAATKAVMTRTTWNWFKKLDYLDESRDLFEEAVKEDPKNVEIRFLRFTVEERIPGYLGYSDHMEIDKVVILKYLENYDSKKIAPEISNFLKERLRESEVFTDEELEKIEEKLST